LHVPSPDWRDQVIYFAMIDRFDDGDPRNNDQGAGEFDPAQRALQRRRPRRPARRLDYIRGLGATAPVDHAAGGQPVVGRRSYGGYHGYWGEHFKQVDPHLGTLDDYRRCRDALHGAAWSWCRTSWSTTPATSSATAPAGRRRDPARGYVPRPDAARTAAAAHAAALRPATTRAIRRSAPRHLPLDARHPRLPDPAPGAAAGRCRAWTT
jgi:hypothetical protein